MPDKIVAQCDCGKKYRVGAEKAGKQLKCKKCGNHFTVPAPEAPTASAPEMSTYAPPPVHIEGDLDVRDPDDLMTEVQRSSMPKTMVFSILGHALVIGLTSFSYYADVAAHWPLWHPNDIETRKREIKREAEEKKRQEERAQREAVRKKEAEEAAKKEAEAKKASDKETKAKEGEGASAEGAEGEEGKDVPEVVKQATEVVKDQPSDTSISLDDDLKLVD